MHLLELIGSFVFGTLIGSFLNVVILRLPKGQKLSGRSHCPLCGHNLTALDLVPIFSFLFLGGKCRFCKHKISWRYWIIELITGLLFALCWQYLQPGNFFGVLQLFRYWLTAASLVVVFVIDLEHYLILDEVVFWASIIITGLNVALDLILHRSFWAIHSYFISGLLGAVVLFGLFLLIWFASSGTWIGFGDVRLAIFLGLTLGWPLILVSLMISVILGGIYSLFLLAFTSKTLKSQIPFGTFLSLGTILALFYGQILLAWYLSILGF